MSLERDLRRVALAVISAASLAGAMVGWAASRLVLRIRR